MCSRYVLCPKVQQESEVRNGRPGLIVSDNRFDTTQQPQAAIDALGTLLHYCLQSDTNTGQLEEILQRERRRVEGYEYRVGQTNPGEGHRVLTSLLIHFSHLICLICYDLNFS